jgi:TPR repeat protein
MLLQNGLQWLQHCQSDAGGTIQESIENKCPFCRHPAPDNYEEVKINLMRRIEVNDPAAMRQMGQFCYIEGDHRGAFEYCSKAAELGNAGAHYLLSFMYDKGEGVEKDKKRKFSIWSRLPWVGIHLLEIVLQILRR